MSTASTTVQALGAQTIEIVKGQSKNFNLDVNNANGGPVDLSGAVVYLTVKKQLSSSAAVIEKNSTIPAQIEITDAAEGQAQIKFSPSDTSGLATGNYVYDIWVELSGGSRYPVVEYSQFVVLNSVTTFA